MSEHERRRVQKDDLHPSLWPMWDQLNAIASDMVRTHRRYVRWRNWSIWSACLNIGALVMLIAWTVLRP